MKVWVLLILLYTLDSSDGNKKLYLLDLYTCVEEFDEYCHLIPRFTLQSVAELANNCTTMLPGYTVYTSGLDVTKSTDDEKVVITAKTLHKFYDKLHELMSQNSTISPIILGSPYSFFNEYAAGILGSKHNFAQVNFESVVTTGDKLPFYNNRPTEMMLNLVRRELMIKHKWRRVGILSSIGSYSIIAEHLKDLLMESGITVISNESLIISKEKKNNSIWNADLQLITLKENDARIIFGFFSPTLLPLIICKGYEMGLVDEYHVWVLLEMSLDDVRRASKRYNDCDAGALLENILMVGKGYVTNATSHNYNLKHCEIPITTSKLDILLAKRYEDIPIMYNVTSVKDIPGYHLSTTIFDTAWAAMLALNKSIELLVDRNMSVDFLLNNEDNISKVNSMVLDVVNMTLRQVKFDGLSGQVDLNDNTTKMVHVLQIITNDSICPVELFSANQTHAISEKICPQCYGYTWGSNPPPSEGIFQALLSTAWLYIISAVIGIFTILALILIMLNILLRNSNYMKSSSLIINILIIVGCTLFICSSILEFLTFNEAQYNSAKFGSLCQVALFLHEFGHTSVHIFLLLKTWRLYRIQTNHLLKKEIKCVSDKAMYLMILILLVPMVILFVFQSIYDPSKFTTRSETIEDRYPYSKMQYSICDDRMYVKISLAAYRIILILCILWQAANVSQMNIRKLALEGDISIRLLIVVVIIVIGFSGIRLGFVHGKLFLEATIMYIMISLSFPVITITILFLPKFYMMLKEYTRSKESSELNSFSKILSANHMIDNFT